MSVPLDVETIFHQGHISTSAAGWSYDVVKLPVAVLISFLKMTAAQAAHSALTLKFLVVNEKFTQS